MARPVVVRVRTRREAQRRIFLLVGFLAAMQIVLDAMEPFVGRFWMLGVRVMGAAVAAVGAVLFEMYQVERQPS